MREMGEAKEERKRHSLFSPSRCLALLNRAHFSLTKLALLFQISHPRLLLLFSAKVCVEFSFEWLSCPFLGWWIHPRMLWISSWQISPTSKGRFNLFWILPNFQPSSFQFRGNRSWFPSSLADSPCRFEESTASRSLASEHCWVEEASKQVNPFTLKFLFGAVYKVEWRIWAFFKLKISIFEDLGSRDLWQYTIAFQWIVNLYKIQTWRRRIVCVWK